MAMLKVVEIGNKVLSSVAKRVDEITPRHLILAQNLIETMYETPGSVGIAAPQVGISESLFVLDVTGHKRTNICHGLIVLFNAEIVSASDPVVIREGCMSVPHLTGDVRRASQVVVRGMDIDGKEKIIQSDAFEARGLLHEIDHLAGKLFIDRIDGPHGLFKRKRYL
ncbi:MAG: peptide deformylase [Acidimicrobiaceae bacterium]|nr:peptide deformylase [Acidimicrobiaceae bacterium]